MNAPRILAVLLALSLLVNIGLIAAFLPSGQAQVGDLIAKTNQLSEQNMQLRQQLAEANLSLEGSSCSLEFYRSRLLETGTGAPLSPSALTGSASMPAPAVSQSVRRVRNGPFIEQVVVLNGSVMNISVTIQPGRGRVLVNTAPLMGIVFQDAAVTAAHVAGNRTRLDLNGTDVIFSIEADREVSAVDGSSAGTLMTLLAIAALEHRDIDPAVTLTGTIDKDGHVGKIGGVVEKATAAREHGITRFLIPRENSALTVYDRQTVLYRGFELVDYAPRNVEAKPYLEENTGITVGYVDSIDDVLAVALKEPAVPAATVP
jgi:predicted S18 family serine protease